MAEITIDIKHPDGRSIHMSMPSEATVNTAVDQVQQWVVNDDSEVGKTMTLETLITGVHIDIKDIEGRIKIEQH